MVRVPGYPVYYAPRLNLNFFFYDGLYWVYSDDRWYASDWYNGPWWEVEPAYMPLFVLRVPIRYYRRPPMHFRYWRADRAPRWDEHWGHDWSRQHRDWNRWDRHTTPAPAPLPDYQRKFPERDYPRAAEQRQTIREQFYRYQPREAVTGQHFQQRSGPKTPRIEQQQRPDAQRQPQDGADYSRAEPRRQHPEGGPPPQQRQPSRGKPPSEELLLERQRQRDRDRHN
ncbi:hypothetical protein GCM10011419_06440 [Vogesella fluminis]|uniref:DUF3300 domain-containing protein n=1 Tax=Vogesella fluminis TaxID=1069161 RepID=A0ABQ3H8B2_9NEIS|nr:hypothetical protein GCM10011419_06440 [Vogesella fluminis]